MKVELPQGLMPSPLLFTIVMEALTCNPGIAMGDVVRDMMIWCLWLKARES